MELLTISQKSISNIDKVPSREYLFIDGGHLFSF
jgi:hypothetical protein